MMHAGLGLPNRLNLSRLQDLLRECLLHGRVCLLSGSKAVLYTVGTRCVALSQPVDGVKAPMRYDVSMPV